MKWVEASARIDGEGAEAASQILERFAFGGVAVEQDPSSKEPALMTVRAYFPADDANAGLIRCLRETWWHLSRARPMGRLVIRVVDDVDWNEAWKRFFTIQRVGRNLVIKPSWREYQEAPGETVIELDPGAAFGTGTHPTTVMCLEAIEELMRPGMRVLDVGTGSGILAIAAAKLGARQVLAVDTDPVAVRVATENCQLSGVEHIVNVTEGSIDTRAEGSFDFVVANIIAGVIVDMSPDIARFLKPGGLLVTSGIIRGRVPEIRRALAGAGLKGISSRRSGAWYSVRARRDI